MRPARLKGEKWLHTCYKTLYSRNVETDLVQALLVAQASSCIQETIEVADAV